MIWWQTANTHKTLSGELLNGKTSCDMSVSRKPRISTDKLKINQVFKTYKASEAMAKGCKFEGWVAHGAEAVKW